MIAPTIFGRRGHGFALLFLALSALITTGAAGDILPSAASSTFPSCGLTCTALTNAQSSCVTGAQSTWVSCFCQSSYLTTLKTSGSVCSDCSSSDQSLLSTWYNNYCNSDGQTSGTSTTTTASASTTSATAGTTAGASTSKTTTSDENKSWWSTHYQWVIMLIVLAVGFSALAAGGVWLKRRYDAKRPGLYHGGSANASSSGVFQRNSGVLSPPPGPWGPSPAPGQSQSRTLAPESVASSSRTEVGPRGGPNLPAPGSRTRLQKGPQSAADVEIRQISRQ
ncbi:hypothetical protein N7462_008294 [Penicillium macrosclerotiorum]|uniref:uncharacterized protein n=1 Tax=Penicillium macrosclerotiorum TaxID=303699 RepID=UPI002546ABCC|nr:uncharacterized protein N7462_008294 [Penicillium macrosclerotiorum]KAJ5675397.1 hypothetical protein N7462_008294 [Penicillium macrosclerotiorum]